MCSVLWLTDRELEDMVNLWINHSDKSTAHELSTADKACLLRWYGQPDRRKAKRYEVPLSRECSHFVRVAGERERCE